MVCEYCGAELRKGIRFCTKCGKEQSNPNADDPAEVIIQPSDCSPQTEETPGTAKESEIATATNQVEHEAASDSSLNESEDGQTPAAEKRVDDEAADDTTKVAPATPIADDTTKVAPATPVTDDTTKAAPATPVTDDTLKAKPTNKTPVKARTAAASVSKGHKVLSVLLCVVIFLSALIASVAGVARASFTEEAVEGTFDDIELSEIDVLRDAKTKKLVKLSDYVFSLCDEKTLDKYSLTKADIKTVIKELEWKDFATDALSDLTGYLIRGEALELEAEDVVDLFKDNEALLTETLNGFKFNYDKIEDAVEDTVITALEPKGLQKSIGIDPSIISAVFSLVMVFVCIGLAVIMAVLILVMNRFSVRAILGYVGMTGIVLGGLLLIAGTVGKIMFLMEGFVFIGAILGKLMLNLLIVGAVILAVSVLLFALSRVLKAAQHKKA